MSSINGPSTPNVQATPFRVWAFGINHKEMTPEVKIINWHRNHGKDIVVDPNEDLGEFISEAREIYNFYINRKKRLPNSS